MRALVWLRRDLRLSDQPALFHACAKAEDGVMAVYIADPSMWQRNDTSAIQVAFLMEGVKWLAKELEKIGIPLCFMQVNKTAEIPAILLSLIKENAINALFFNQEYEINETRRDQQVCELLQKNQIKYEIFSDQLIVDEQWVRSQKGEFFKVFTPFRKKWREVFLREKIELLPVPKSRKTFALAKQFNTDFLEKINKLDYIKNVSEKKLARWPAGEIAAKKRLDHFIQKDLFSYHTQRDFPYLHATSSLSPWLATGMISPRVCFMAAWQANANQIETGNAGAVTWMSELVWREFYRHVLIHFPRVCMRRAFKPETEKLIWRENSAWLIAWQQGQTGYPFVDAAMRQLNQTGWMHNRLRMVVAMFFSKNLFLDWRLGEKYFATHLIDYDFASNNGGWQWSASTGTDAVPYFRIFNPITQSQRFDPEGKFIRQYCPELSALSDQAIHDPWTYQPLFAAKAGYPKPIVDHKATREQAIAAFSALTD